MGSPETRSTLRFRNVLDQKGPLGLVENYAPHHAVNGFDGRKHIRTWLSTFGTEDRAFYRGIQKELTLILGVESLAEVPTLSQDPKRRKETSEKLYGMIGRQYDIRGPKDIKDHVSRYADTADRVIEYLRENVLSQQGAITEITNDIRHTRNPLDLLLITFDPVNYSKRARFEAKRKIMLMELAAAVDYEERKQHPSDKLKQFDEFLNTANVWKEDRKIGDGSVAYLYSKHDPEDFQCLNVEVLNETDGRERMNEDEPHTLITPVRRRTFVHRGKERFVYISTRPKDPVAKILKMLRKDTDNTATAVEDDLGVMAVFEKVGDVNAFQDVLQEAQAAQGYLPSIRDFSDSLKDGSTGDNLGSSAKTQMRKMFLNFPDYRIEVILHTAQSLLNYRYRHEVGHREYVSRRLFDSGVVATLFPPDSDMYPINMARAREDQIKAIRKQ